MHFYDFIQLNETAEIAGIRKGMTPSQALARCLSVVIKARARMQEKSIDEIVLQYAFSLSPFVEATEPGVCTIQFTESLNLSGQPRQSERMLWRISGVIEKLAESEITAQAAIAPTPDTSFLAAHVAKPVLHIENSKEFLSSLPIETLATLQPRFG